MRFVNNILLITMAKKDNSTRKSLAKQRKAAKKRMRTWVTRIAIILLALSFIAFMVVSLFSAPKIV